VAPADEEGRKEAAAVLFCSPHPLQAHSPMPSLPSSPSPSFSSRPVPCLLRGPRAPPSGARTSSSYDARSVHSSGSSSSSRVSIRLFLFLVVSSALLMVRRTTTITIADVTAAHDESKKTRGPSSSSDAATKRPHPAGVRPAAAITTVQAPSSSSKAAAAAGAQPQLHSIVDGGRNDDDGDDKSGDSDDDDDDDDDEDGPLLVPRGDENRSAPPTDGSEPPRSVDGDDGRRTVPSPAAGAAASAEDDDDDPPSSSSPEPSTSNVSVPAPPPLNVTVLCHMSGEMGNHLDIYAHCHIVRKMLSASLASASTLYPGGGAVQVVVRHATFDEWDDPVLQLRQCFPHFRQVDFEAGNDEMYDRALLFQLLQEKRQRHRGEEEEDGTREHEHNEEDDEEEEVRLGADQLVRNAFVTMATRHEPATVQNELDAFVLRLRESDPPLLLSSSRSTNSTHAGAAADEEQSTRAPAATIHPLSVLYVQWLFSVDAFVDQFIEELRTLYSFLHNSTDCCRSVPDPDETVFVRCLCFLTDLSLCQIELTLFVVFPSTYATLWWRCPTLARRWDSRSCRRTRPPTTCSGTCIPETRWRSSPGLGSSTCSHTSTRWNVVACRSGWSRGSPGCRTFAS
jgi:hypothetical protein